MRLISLLLLGVILPVSGWARIGDTIDELRKRYGTAERLHDEIGGLTVVEFTKPPYVFKFQLLDLKAEGVEINGIISQEEAEVLIARNVPSQKFSLDLNPHTPYAKEFAFWKAYIFTDDSTAYYYSLRGEVSSGIKILTPKMATYNEWREKSEKTQKINDANLMIDSIEKPDPSTALQSDRNTAAASKVVNGTDPTLGGQEGKKNDSLTMQNSQFSPNPASPPPPPASVPPQPNPHCKLSPTPLEMLRMRPTPPWLLLPTFSAIEVPSQGAHRWVKMPPLLPREPPSAAISISSTSVSAHVGI